MDSLNSSLSDCISESQKKWKMNHTVFVIFSQKVSKPVSIFTNTNLINRMAVLFYVTATSCCTSITVSSRNFRNDKNHHGSIHDINKQATFFISLTTAFETRKIWKIVEYKVYTELQKMKYLHGISRRKSSEAKSHEIIRNVGFF